MINVSDWSSVYTGDCFAIEIKDNKTLNLPTKTRQNAYIWIQTTRVELYTDCSVHWDSSTAPSTVQRIDINKHGFRLINREEMCFSVFRKFSCLYIFNIFSRNSSVQKIVDIINRYCRKFKMSLHRTFWNTTV